MLDNARTTVRQIDEDLAGQWYSQWAMLQRIKQVAIAGEALAVLWEEPKSKEEFHRIVFMIDEEVK